MFYLRTTERINRKEHHRVTRRWMIIQHSINRQVLFDICWMIKQHLPACQKMKQRLVFDRLLSHVLLLTLMNSLEIEMTLLQHDAL